MKNKWSDFERDDLRCIPMMEAAGFKVIFSNKDIRTGRVTPEFFPMDSVSFEKGNFHTWRTINNKRNNLCWQTARLIDSHYRGHKMFDTLEEVIKYEKEQ